MAFLEGKSSLKLEVLATNQASDLLIHLCTAGLLAPVIARWISIAGLTVSEGRLTLSARSCWLPVNLSEWGP